MRKRRSTEFTRKMLLHEQGKRVDGTYFLSENFAFACAGRWYYFECDQQPKPGTEMTRKIFQGDRWC